MDSLYFIVTDFRNFLFLEGISKTFKSRSQMIYGHIFFFFPRCLIFIMYTDPAIQIRFSPIFHLKLCFFTTQLANLRTLTCHFACIRNMLLNKSREQIFITDVYCRKGFLLAIGLSKFLLT